MSDLPISETMMKKICKNGTYYNPASSHYGTQSNVMCDKCYEDNLKSSIGWESYDLCLTCVDEINAKPPVKRASSRKRMHQRQFNK